MQEFKFLNITDNNYLQSIISACPTTPDLTNIEHSDWVEKTSNELMRICKNQENAKQLEDELFSMDRELPALFLLALKNCISRFYIINLETKIRVSVVFAIYKEHERMLTKAEHPFGEDFIARKISQMKWLFNNKTNIDWELIIVDDGCPENSGKKAEEIIKNRNLPNVKVLYLQDAIDQKLEVVSPMQSTSDSQKGGSIAYGMWHAAQEETNNKHIIIFTDADLSTHLGQTGLLLQPILSNSKKAAIASRREKQSVTIKQGGRNDRGKLFIYLWKRMIPNLNYIIDTQCGFKAFDKDTLAEIVEDLLEKRFAFDIELLLKTELLESHSIEKVAIAWIDSEAASTTTDIQPYLPMLKSIAKMHEKYLPAKDMASSFIGFIQSLSEDQFQYLLNHIPEEITKKEPVEFNNFNEISANHLKEIVDYEKN